MPTIKTALSLYQKISRASESPQLDADLLLAHVLKKPREYLYTYPEKNLTAAQYSKYKILLGRRARYWPIAYLTGHKEFYGLDFLVNMNVLIPRPETEQIVDLVIKISPRIKRTDDLTVADIGTGCGNIAVAIKKQAPAVKVIATDISAKALKVAKHNARRQQAKIEFYLGDLLNALPKKYLKKIDVIIANLPYLSAKDAAKKSLSREPKIALTPRGRKPADYLINRLKKQAPDWLAPGGKIILEGKDGKVTVSD